MSDTGSRRFGADGRGKPVTIVLSIDARTENVNDLVGAVHGLPGVERVTLGHVTERKRYVVDWCRRSKMGTLYDAANPSSAVELACGTDRRALNKRARELNRAEEKP